MICFAFRSYVNERYVDLLIGGTPREFEQIPGYDDKRNTIEFPDNSEIEKSVHLLMRR